MSRRNQTDHIRLLCSVGDLAARLAGSPDIHGFLNQIVQMVGDTLESSVCSIYVYDQGREKLILRATRGLNPETVDNLALDLGEGLAGLALKELRPVREDHASANPHYRPVPGSREELYDSYLAVPVRKGIEKIGVLVVQREKARPFDEEDTRAMQAIAAQIASAIENARILLRLQSAPEEAEQVTAPDGTHEALTLVRGAVASGGFAYGPVMVQDVSRRRRAYVRSGRPDVTLEDFQDALVKTGQQLQELQRRIGERLPEMASLIFDAHLMMLKDPNFVGEMTEAIREGENPIEAVGRVGYQYVEMFEDSREAYVREKAQDVADLLRRLVANLTGESEEVAQAGGAVVLARDLYPSDMLKLALEGAQGVVLVSGGVTSHVSILARSLQLPMIIVEDERLLSLPSGTQVLLNTEAGSIYVNPAGELVEQFRQHDRAEQALQAERRGVKPTTHTADGTRVRLLANINLLTELSLARDVKAEGVGLYRSEFPFLVRAGMPTEDEQREIYRLLMDGADGRPVAFRTLDIGGDKLLAYYDTVGEENPTMGLRSIRFSLRHMELFEKQLRAVLRAGIGGDLRIMFPMISSVDEFVLSRDVVYHCVRQLEQEGLEHHREPKVGLMVEVPSAVAMIDALCEEADFVCVGTNDLTQFLLAVDRTNEKVANYFSSHHPAVLRALERIATKAAEAGVEASVCGELAHDEMFLPFLLGVGFPVLSVDPQFLPALQRQIARLDMSHCRSQAQAMLEQRTVEGVAGLLGIDPPRLRFDDRNVWKEEA
ncbi:MAG: phosphoenolpyruvate--protein phosphotransferase [Phycisphaerae bacterium]